MMDGFGHVLLWCAKHCLAEVSAWLDCIIFVVPHELVGETDQFPKQTTWKQTSRLMAALLQKTGGLVAALLQYFQ